MANRKLYEYLNPATCSLKLIESDDGRELYMSGLMIQGDIENQNGRIYPKNEIVAAVESVKKRLANGESVMGELDHPEELQINLDRVSHIIVDMQTNGADGVGKLKILETPMGNIAKTLLQNGVKLGVSSRGSGNVEDNGHVSDFDIITVDIVAQPSAPDAFPESIYESLYNTKGGAEVYRTAEAVKYDSGAKKHLAKAMKSFIQKLTI